MIIGISGGTGSGKTTVAQKIISSVGVENVVYLQQDAYYRNLGDMPVDLRHSRRPETTHIEPRPVIIIEGILAFANPQMRALMDMKIFVDTDPDIRFIRRLDRDVHERGRSVESIISQYTTTVRPMHLQFVEPSKRYADIIIPEGGYNDVGMDLITCKLRSILAGSAAEDEIPIHSDGSNGSDRSQVRG